MLKTFLNLSMTLTYLNSTEHIWHSSNKWLQSYLSNPNQHVSINVYDPGLAAINWTPLTGLSSTTPSTFIIYERLHQAIKFCKVHHFTNDSIVCRGLQSPTWKKPSWRVNSHLKWYYLKLVSLCPLFYYQVFIFYTKW